MAMGGPAVLLWFRRLLALACPIYVFLAGCSSGNGAPAIPTITPRPAFTMYVIPGGASNPEGIIPGSDGELWFADTTFFPIVSRIGRISTTGVVTMYNIPGPAAFPQDLAKAPDG